MGHMAGLAGLEPTNAGVKVLCLTDLATAQRLQQLSCCLNSLLSISQTDLNVNPFLEIFNKFFKHFQFICFYVIMDMVIK